jgi:hypothetical protein
LDALQLESIETKDDVGPWSNYRPIALSGQNSSCAAFLPSPREMASFQEAPNMPLRGWIKFLGAAVAVSAFITLQPGDRGLAQTTSDQAAATQPAVNQPKLLAADELETLVARVALYPDDLVALVMAGSLYPLQIVQAQRYLGDVKAKPDLKPDSSWDGSVVSLLNYPQIVKMMNDDLDWTQAMGDAVVNQQKDVLIAIQQLRDKARSQWCDQERRQGHRREAEGQYRHQAGEEGSHLCAAI